MSLELDKRQRAMLREMGVRVWQPMDAVAAPVAAAALAPMPAGQPAAPAVAEKAAPVQSAVAIDSVAGRAQSAPAVAAFDQKMAPSRPAQPIQPDAGTEGAAAWNMGKALALYADAAHTDGPRWLVLAETPAAALQSDAFNPFDGDAGKLLDNMLRAARLHKAGAVTLAPLVRRGASDASLAAALPALVLEARPDVVLVMGRLAAQALLQSNEPFGKLRGQVHSLHGVQTIVTHDAPYLLRIPADKAKAWEDLCLAISVAGAARSRAA
ncbi:MAG: uracil-DNA glycosylase family protein [Pseudomonadota bacterium]